MHGFQSPAWCTFEYISLCYDSSHDYHYFIAGTIIITSIITLKTNYCKNESNLTSEAVTHVYKYQLIGSLTQCHLMVIIIKHTNTLTVMAAGGKRLSYTIYKLQVIDYAKEHDNTAATRAFGPPPTEKIFCVWRQPNCITHLDSLHPLLQNQTQA